MKSSCKLNSAIQVIDCRKNQVGTKQSRYSISLVTGRARWLFPVFHLAAPCPHPSPRAGPENLQKTAVVVSSGSPSSINKTSEHRQAFPLVGQGVFPPLFRDFPPSATAEMSVREGAAFFCYGRRGGQVFYIASRATSETKRESGGGRERQKEVVGEWRGIVKEMSRDGGERKWIFLTGELDSAIFPGFPGKLFSSTQMVKM